MRVLREMDDQTKATPSGLAPGMDSMCVRVGGRGGRGGREKVGEEREGRKERDGRRKDGQTERLYGI